MLECVAQDGIKYFYIGSTNSMERRFTEHALGEGAKFTKDKQLKLVFYQTFRTRSDAMLREQAIKKMPRLKKQALIDDIFENEYLVEDTIEPPRKKT